ncbi:MAG: succinylglutamate desuccinylase/aspartoacylase family protein [Candidatus Amesbacteria bacterium]|nr:succinylglutamate desuccinylase/aspartoacylase family protein [Candidatus Amesbacteria bacterium]
MNKKFLITTVTHGDEGFAIPVVEKLAKKFNFAWQKNNLKAFKLNNRFFQKDLNRSGPGDPKSKIYEEKIAYKIIKKASTYDRVIDIHGSTADCGVFALLSEPSTENIELAKKFDVDNVVLWPSMRTFDAPLSQFIPNCLELECGPKDEPKTANELSRVLNNFLQNKLPKSKQNFYIVTGLIRGKIKTRMQDFQKVKYKGQTFVPLLVDQYPGIKCYTMQKISYTLAT